jgi:hypothetical protein
MKRSPWQLRMTFPVILAIGFLTCGVELAAEDGNNIAASAVSVLRMINTVEAGHQGHYIALTAFPIRRSSSFFCI